MRLGTLASLQAILGWVPGTTNPSGLSNSLESGAPNAMPVTSTGNGAACCNTTTPLRLISHNIRYATPSPFKGERPWRDRRPLIVAELASHTRYLDGSLGTGHAGGFVCLQEVLHEQLIDVLTGLNGHADDYVTAEKDQPLWSYIGVGRDDGKKRGEYSPIFYPNRLFELLHYESKWLSPTPDRPGKGWDAGSTRILTIGVFRHRQTGQRFVASNTHLDDRGSQARREGAKLILASLEDVRRRWADEDANPLPFFLAGDFNSLPTQEAYQVLNNSDRVIDVYERIAPKRRFGEESTFTGFDPAKTREDDIGRIDFVWLGPKDSVLEEGQRSSNKQHWRVEGYAVVPNLFEAGVYSSDHRAVVADVLLRS